MPRRYLMSDLVTRCQRRADLENNGHISDAEWKALISEIYGELFNIVARSGSRYFESEYTITADGSTSYDEPEDHLYTIGVEFVVDATSGRRRALREVMVAERARVMGLTGEACFWEHVDDQIRLYPKPSSGTYKLVYVPQPPDLSAYADDDVVDVVAPDGEAFLLWGTAVLAHAKGETSAVLAVQRQEAARERLEMWAAEHGLANPRVRVELSSDPLDGNPDWRYR